MSSDLVVKHFEGKPVAFRCEGGKLTLTMKESGELLCYKNPAISISNLYQEHKDEFDSDCTQLTVSVMPEVNRPPTRERVFTLDGLILLCMFSEQPIAKKVRKWLRRVGREVMTTGGYVTPEFFQQYVARMDEVLGIVNDVMKTQAATMEVFHQRMEQIEGRVSEVLVPAEPDISGWPTPAGWVKTLVRVPVPKYFNRGGNFDLFATEEHRRQFGGFLRLRFRRHLQKDPEYVIEPCPEMSRFLKETYAKYMRNWPPKKQTALKLLPVREEKS